MFFGEGIVGEFVLGFEPAHKMPGESFSFGVVASEADLAEECRVAFDGVGCEFAPDGSDDDAIAIGIGADVAGGAGDGFFLHHRIVAGVFLTDRVKHIALFEILNDRFSLVLDGGVTVETEPLGRTWFGEFGLVLQVSQGGGVCRPFPFVVVVAMADFAVGSARGTDAMEWFELRDHKGKCLVGLEILVEWDEFGCCLGVACGGLAVEGGVCGARGGFSCRCGRDGCLFALPYVPTRQTKKDEQDKAGLLRDGARHKGSCIEKGSCLRECAHEATTQAIICLLLL